MDILAVTIVVVVVGVVASIVLGQPLLIVVALVVGALVANRRGYRHQAQAIRSELRPQPAPTVPPLAEPRSTEDRLAAVERLRSAGTITDAEAAARRSAILDDL